MTLKTLDLFAGVGGVRLGFELAGFETVFANDIEPNCKITYDLNFAAPKMTVKSIMDIRSNELPDFDILLGGFPCQPFSIAGYQKGFEDEKGRGNLFFKIAEILDECQPQAFMLENVKNLVSHDEGKTFKIIMKTLTDLGYHVTSQILNTREHGNIPQNRERIFIVGFKSKEQADKFQFPEKIKPTNTVIDMLDADVPDKYYYEGKSLHAKLVDHVVEHGRVYQWRRQYVRENKARVCPTLTANMGTGGNNVPIVLDAKGIRKLTPRECFRFQGFPDSYTLPALPDSTIYKQAGNSVTVTVIQAIATKMMEALRPN